MNFAGPDTLALVFAGLMGFSILAYVILDGFDLGVGVLLTQAEGEDRDTMIASIGPFWDANETWLVLGIGILLVAFPLAHGVILTALYFPVFTMLVGLILRGVAFDFRAKVAAENKRRWDWSFILGSLLAAFSQGFMLGLYIVGLAWTVPNILFAVLTGLCLIAGYAFIGAAWLIMKTEGALQVDAVRWARVTLWFAAVGMVAISLATPFISPRVFENWFSFPSVIFLAPIPIAAAALFAVLYVLLPKLPLTGDRFCWVPFVATVGIYVLGFLGLAYSFYPYIVPDKLKIVESASAPESLAIILAGVLVVVPVILGYSVYAYRVFWGKATKLAYY